MTVKKEAGDLELMTNGVIREKGNSEKVIMRLVYASDERAESVLKHLADNYKTQPPPPECGHSVCRQNFIDTAENHCVAGEHDA